MRYHSVDSCLIHHLGACAVGVYGAEAEEVRYETGFHFVTLLIVRVTAYAHSTLWLCGFSGPLPVIASLLPSAKIRATIPIDHIQAMGWGQVFCKLSARGWDEL